MTLSASLSHIHPIGPLRELGPGVHNRFVVHPDDLRGQSPFVLLVEDFIEPQGDYDMHPHRGLATVTFILDGRLAHRDHCGTSGVVGPGDVQWMTAGRGIMHGGRPEGTYRVHALQLWLNLPAALKMSEPKTKEQKRDSAGVHPAPGVEARNYGAMDARWTPWPMELVHIRIDAGARYDLPIAGGNRAFAYVIEGQLAASSEQTTLDAGHVGWVQPAAEDQVLPLHAIAASTLLVYISRPIEEPVIVHGPFVVNKESEIIKAYLDLQDGRFLDVQSSEPTD